jgi:predicted nucleic acid-binding protein
MNRLFMDSSYAIALGSPRDRHHADAVALAHRIKTERIRVITTRAVIIEVGDALSKGSLRSRAIALLDLFDGSPLIEVTPLSEELYERGRTFFRRHLDKEWGLTDCISFVVMKDRGLTDALTADAHFRQAGFRPLLSSAGDR